MKTYLVTILAAGTLLAACNEETAEHKRFESKLDSLNVILNEKDSTINDLFTSFDEIEQNLDSVAFRQNIISAEVEKQKGELKGDSKGNINNQIAAINNLMEQNRQKIEELNDKLKKSTLKIKQFQKMIKGLNEEIAQKTAELQSLNDKLNSVNAQVAELQTSIGSLSNINASQSQVISDQTASLHTAYYLIGKAKELEEKKIIDRKGGVLGIGKTAKLNSDINKNNFTKIDYTQVSTIPINSKKATIVTSHPSSSYALDKDAKNDQITNLRILEPENFWSESKYLVVAK
ncbi:MAG: hypothetical protein V4608_01805 [Bacteroidota bacterium]